jgi:hypothetical protein
MAIRLPSVDDFSDRLRGPQVTSRVGRWLGIAFSVAFLTGIWSHLQYSPGWLPLPTRPVRLYQVTQGLHVVSGTVCRSAAAGEAVVGLPAAVQPASAPLRELVLHLLERLSILVLISAAIFQLSTGLTNSAQWYPWGFSFRTMHYAVAWVAITALAFTSPSSCPLIRRSLSTPCRPPSGERAQPARPAADHVGGVRAGRPGDGRCDAGAAAQGVGVRRPQRERPAGLPVNRSAAAAGVLGLADDPAWRLEVTYDGRTTSYARSDLEAMEQTPRTCRSRAWRGGAPPGPGPACGWPISFGRSGHRPIRASSSRHCSDSDPFAPASFRPISYEDPLTLLALALER